MSVLTNNDLHTPFGSLGIQKLKSIIVGEKTHQGTAADLTTTFVATQGGKLLDIYIVLAAAFEAAETMTIDVQVNGASILTGAVPFAMTAATAINEQVKIGFVADTTIATGDKIDVIRNWTTGGGADTTPANVVGLEWADRSGKRV